MRMHFQAAETRAHMKRIAWQKESEKHREEKAEREAAFVKYIQRKRMREAETNDQRLSEARTRLERSQELLRRLIEEKEEKQKQRKQGETANRCVFQPRTTTTWATRRWWRSFGRCMMGA